MRARAGLALLLVAGMAACGGDVGTGPGGGPLTIVSVQPAEGATDVETGVVVQAIFGGDVDPTTLTSSSFTLDAGGTPVPAVVSYDAATRTGRMVGPILPGSTYGAAVSAGVADAEGRPLAEVRQWSFTTRAWQSTTLDESGNTGEGLALALDPAGRVHLSYADAADGDLEYASCPSRCSEAGNWEAVTVDEAGTIRETSSLVADGTGRLHVTYWELTHGDLRYATCAAECATATNWQSVTVHSGGAGYGSSLTIDAAGRLHVSYSGNGNLLYATCAAACAAATNWQTGTIRPNAIATRWILRVGPTGQLDLLLGSSHTHVLEYVTCGAGCTAEANWYAAVISEDINVGDGSPSFAMDHLGRLHASWVTTSTGRTLKYAVCAAGCAVAGSWHSTLIDGAGGVTRVTITVDPVSRAHIVYSDADHADLRYATCAVGCTTAGNWHTAVVGAEAPTKLGVAVDGNGRVRVGYVIGTRPGLRLRYME